MRGEGDDMILHIDQTDQTPVYQQIRDQIVAAIAREELLPADRLPSVRTLACDLGVNLHTVNKAYAVLRDEGYLLMRGRSGAIVADFGQVATPERVAANAERLATGLRQLALEHCAQGGTEETFLEAARTQATCVFSDSGVAGVQRDVRVLGLDERSDCLGADGSHVRHVAPRASGTAPEGA